MPNPNFKRGYRYNYFYNPYNPYNPYFVSNRKLITNIKNNLPSKARDKSTGSEWTPDKYREQES